MSSAGQLTLVTTTTFWNIWTTPAFLSANQALLTSPSIIGYPDQVAGQLAQDFGYSLFPLPPGGGTSNDGVHMDLVLDPAVSGIGHTGTIFGGYGVTMDATFTTGSFAGIQSFWYYIFALHEPANVWCFSIAGGWPWADGSSMWGKPGQLYASPFPNAVDIIVARELGLNSVSQEQASRELVDAGVNLFYTIQQTYGWGPFQDLFRDIRQVYTGIKDWHAYQEPLRTAIIAWFLSSAVGTSLLSQFNQATSQVSGNTIDDATYASAQAMFPAPIGTVTTTLTEFLSSLVVAPGGQTESVTLSGALTRNDTGQGLFNAGISVSVDGVFYSPVSTDSTGAYLTTELSGLSTSSSHTVAVNYAGDPTNNLIGKSNAQTIPPLGVGAITLSATTPTSGIDGFTVRFQAVVTSTAGSPMQNVSGLVTEDGSVILPAVVWGPTDSTGTTNFPLSFTANTTPATFSIVVVSGSVSGMPSVLSNAVSVTVTAPAAPVLATVSFTALSPTTGASGFIVYFQISATSTMGAPMQGVTGGIAVDGNVAQGYQWGPTNASGVVTIGIAYGAASPETFSTVAFSGSVSSTAVQASVTSSSAQQVATSLSLSAKRVA